MTKQLPNFLIDNNDGDVGVLWSSGMESTLLLLLCIEKYGKDRVHAFTQKFPIDDPFERAQRHYHYFAEIIAEQLDFSHHHVIELPSTGLMSNELRPMLYHTAVSIVPTMEVIYVGVNTTHFGPLTDQSRRNEIAQIFGDLSLLNAPFASIDKAETIKMYHEYGYSDWLPLTRSCAKPTYQHCGTCANCTERKYGFAQSGFSDPTTYNTD